MKKLSSYNPNFHYCDKILEQYLGPVTARKGFLHNPKYQKALCTRIRGRMRLFSYLLPCLGISIQTPRIAQKDRKSVEKGQRVGYSEDLGGRRIIEKKS